MPAARHDAAAHSPVVDTANSLQSDLVVLLGDFTAWYRFKTEPVADPVWAAELARLAAPLGTWAILGNHDWWHDLRGVRRALADVRIPMLENDAVMLGAAGQQFWLAGLGDQLAYQLGHGRISRRRRSAGHFVAHQDRRSGAAPGSRAGYFPKSSNARGADARRSHAWRTDPRAADLAPFRAVALRRAFRLWPYRRE
jgi:hypothetical protein